MLTGSEVQDGNLGAAFLKQNRCSVDERFHLEAAALPADVDCQVKVTFDNCPRSHAFQIDFQRQARHFKLQRCRIDLAAGAVHTDLQRGVSGLEVSGL